MNADQSTEEPTCSSGDNHLKPLEAEPHPVQNGTEGCGSTKACVNKGALIRFGEEPGDVLINTGDMQFSCHKHLLSRHSQYFQAMFESGMKESRSEEIHLENISSDSFHCLLNYFYTGDLDLNLSNVQGMAEVSSRLQVQLVLDQCSDLLLTLIEDDLCLSLMRLANFLSLPEVYNRCRQHALWYFQRIIQTEDFHLSPSVQVKDYLQDPYLNIDSEADVFHAAAVWYSSQEEPCDVTDLTEFFGSVVNFHLMSDDEVLLLQDSPITTKKTLLETFLASLSRKDVITQLRSMGSTRERTSPRHGRILCVGAHQCSVANWKKTCPYIDNQRAPLDVLGFEPDSCSLDAEPLATLTTHYPELALDSGYRVCAIGCLVYIVGGEASLGRNKSWITTVWCLDTLTGSWHEAGTLQQVRRHHGLCAQGNTLYLIGGIGRFRVRLESVESFDTDTKQWRKLPDMLYQETSPAVTQHKGSIYVFKNYAQTFHIASATWTFLKLTTPVPGLPIYACPDPTPGTNNLLVSCFHSDSLWCVNLEKQDTEQVTKFDKEGGGGVLCRGRFYHFQLHEAGLFDDTHVESYAVGEKVRRVTGILPGTVLTSHFVTVPRFPRFKPSSTNKLC